MPLLLMIVIKIDLFFDTDDWVATILNGYRSTSISSDNIVNELRTEFTTSASESGSSMKVSMRC